MDGDQDPLHRAQARGAQARIERSARLRSELLDLPIDALRRQFTNEIAQQLLEADRQAVVDRLAGHRANVPVKVSSESRALSVVPEVAHAKAASCSRARAARRRRRGQLIELSGTTVAAVLSVAVTAAAVGGWIVWEQIRPIERIANPQYPDWPYCARLNQGVRQCVYRVQHQTDWRHFAALTGLSPRQLQAFNAQHLRLTRPRPGFDILIPPR